MGKRNRFKSVTVELPAVLVSAIDKVRLMEAQREEPGQRHFLSGPSRSEVVEMLVWRGLSK